jgi:hypothetical protein
LKALYQKLSRRTDKFVMISMATGMDEPEWRQFLVSQSVTWPQTLLVGGSEKVWDDFRVGFIPDYALIGPDGKIIADGQSTGLDVEKLESAIDKALANP